MTIGERIREVRKSKKLTQQAFADILGVKRNTVGCYEINQTLPSDRTINDICREFNVNEQWLRCGEGEMFNPEMTVDEAQINAVIRELGLSGAIAQFTSSYLRLAENEKEAVKRLINEMIEKHDAEALPASETDLASRVVQLEQQNRDLAAKVAAMEEEDAKFEKLLAERKAVGLSRSR